MRTNLLSSSLQQTCHGKIKNDLLKEEIGLEKKEFEEIGLEKKPEIEDFEHMRFKRLSLSNMKGFWREKIKNHQNHKTMITIRPLQVDLEFLARGYVHLRRERAGG